MRYSHWRQGITLSCPFPLFASPWLFPIVAREITLSSLLRFLCPFFFPFFFLSSVNSTFPLAYLNEWNCHVLNDHRCPPRSRCFFLLISSLECHWICLVMRSTQRRLSWVFKWLKICIPAMLILQCVCVCVMDVWGRICNHLNSRLLHFCLCTFVYV